MAWAGGQAHWEGGSLSGPHFALGWGRGSRSPNPRGAGALNCFRQSDWVRAVGQKQEEGKEKGHPQPEPIQEGGGRRKKWKQSPSLRGQSEHPVWGKSAPGKGTRAELEALPPISRRRSQSDTKPPQGADSVGTKGRGVRRVLKEPGNRLETMGPTPRGHKPWWEG